MRCGTTINRRSFLCLCGIALMSLPLSKAWAFERADHDDLTEEVLFGHANKLLGDATQEKAKKALECAVYLCLDQMRGDGDGDLETLRNHHVNGLPRIDEIDLSGINYGQHDKYTHMGWHHNYTDDENLEREYRSGAWQERWVKRKKLLLNTVNAVFDFGLIDEAKMGLFGLSAGKCDAFAELLYYAHVLGDFQDKIQDNLKNAKYKMDLKAIPFAVEGANDDNRDFFWDLDESLRIIAAGTDAQNDYENLSRKLEKIASPARRLGTVGTKKDAERFRKYVIETRELLKKHVPTLLGNVEFFRNTFGHSG